LNTSSAGRTKRSARALERRNFNANANEDANEAANEDAYEDAGVSVQLALSDFILYLLQRRFNLGRGRATLRLAEAMRDLRRMAVAWPP